MASSASSSSRWSLVGLIRSSTWAGDQLSRRGTDRAGWSGDRACRTPVGFYTVLAEGDRFKVKTIEVRPGQRLELSAAQAARRALVRGRRARRDYPGRAHHRGAVRSIPPTSRAALLTGFRTQALSPWYSLRFSMVTSSARTTSFASDDDYGRLEADALSADRQG